MCKAMEDMRKEERMEAEYEAHLATAKILLKQGVYLMSKYRKQRNYQLMILNL